MHVSSRINLSAANIRLISNREYDGLATKSFAAVNLVVTAATVEMFVKAIDREAGRKTRF